MGVDARLHVGQPSPRALFMTGVVAALAVAPILLLGARFGFVAEVHTALLLGGLLGALVIGNLAKVLFPPGRSSATVFLRGLMMSAGTGAVMYLTGWGAVLSVGLMFVAVEQVRLDGSRAARPAAIATAFVIVIGEGLVALEAIPSLMPQPEGHGVALLAVAGAWTMIGVLGFGAREKEGVEVSLRNSEERFRALVLHASDGILVAQPDGTVVYASPAIERVLGPRLGGLARLTRDLVHPDHVDEARAFTHSIRGQSGAVGWIELPLLHADGRYRWFEIGLSNCIDDPAVGGLVLNIRDVSERRSAQEQLTFQAYHDALTKLPNRWMFMEKLEQALFEASRTRRQVGVCFLDIDRFKMVNDSLGHELGDRVLVAVAERLRDCVRPSDVVARFGGDEFTILLPAVRDADRAARVVERITEQLREPIVIGEQKLFISASVGLALSSDGEDRARDLLRQSDLAMYVAKEKGRARWELFDAAEVPNVVDRLELEGDLWRAFDNGELEVHFQPEVDLRTGAVVGTEALVRWNHPRRGLLEPDAFIPYAEESRLIVALDRYVLKHACIWAKRWSGSGAHPPLIVSVNLSTQFIRQAEFVVEVTQALREAGLDPRALQIEVTERSALTDIDATHARLQQLRAMGVRIAIDDFGTGYSSLAYLKTLPIDVLKLDRSLLASIDTLDADVAIVEAVVTMGHALGLRVIAEGVERQAQADRLRELKCDWAMGWLWSRALPAEQVAARVATGFVPETTAQVLQMRRGS